LTTDEHPLDYIFHPRSVAVVGAPTHEGPGGFFVGAIKEAGFPGPIYPVNPKATEIQGLTCYPSLRDVPGPVDYVISSVPARVVPQLVEDCGSKGVKALHFFTAGFSETGEEERADLEKRAVERAREFGIRIIGPNCMGLYVPSAGLSFMPGLPNESGPVAFISQSGANAGDFIRATAVRGIRYSKVISYGNAADLDESDFFEYCAADPDTRVIASYIEGVKDGRHFLQALRQAATVKPVVVLKGGRTEAGGRAAHSHTGALAGSIEVFDAACRQAGAVRVNTLEDLTDVTVAMTFLSGLSGRRVGIIGSGGGQSVLAADEAASVGLEVPVLSDETQEKLRQFTPVAGTSTRNPVDTYMGWVGGPERLVDTIRLVANAPNIDSVLLHIHFDGGAMRMDPVKRAEALADAIAEALPRFQKPLTIVARPAVQAEGFAASIAFQERVSRAGVAVFSSIVNAARALGHLLDWQQGRRDLVMP
jgi:acyl-CoA synthetase (NDP forming)